MFVYGFMGINNRNLTIMIILKFKNFMYNLHTIFIRYHTHKNNKKMFTVPK